MEFSENIVVAVRVGGILVSRGYALIYSIFHYVSSCHSWICSILRDLCLCKDSSEDTMLVTLLFDGKTATVLRRMNRPEV